MGSMRLVMGLLLLGAALLLVAPADGAIGALTASPGLRRTPSLGLRGGVTRLVLRGGEDGEEDEEEEEEEVSDGLMTVAKALKEVLYYSNCHDGCLRGLKEVRSVLAPRSLAPVVLFRGRTLALTHLSLDVACNAGDPVDGAWRGAAGGSCGGLRQQRVRGTSRGPQPSPR